MLDRPVLYGGVRHILLTRTSRAGGRHAGLRTGPGRRGGVRRACASRAPGIGLDCQRRIARARAADQMKIRPRGPVANGTCNCRHHPL